MGFFKNLTKSFFHSAKEDKKEECPPHPEPFFSQWVTYGDHPNRTPGEKTEVIFVNPEKEIAEIIVDSDGKIRDFPGIANPEVVAGHLAEKKPPEPVVRFRTEFQKLENKYLMLWQIQPNGKYWANIDGREVTNDKEVILYTYVNDYGKLRFSFQLYQVGETNYFETNLEKKEAKQLFEQKLEHYVFCAIDYFIDMIRKEGPDSTEFDLLDSGKVGVFALFKSYHDDGTYGFLAGMRKKDSDELHQFHLLNGYSKEEILRLLGEEKTRQTVVSHMKKLSEYVDRD